MKIMRSCREIARLMSRAQDEVLSRRERWAIDIHQLFCVYCRRYGTQLAFLRKVLRTSQGAEAVKGLDAEARARIADTIKSER